MIDGARVAVVVPCFDDGPTLTEAIESARAQRRPVELVVVDDGSTETATLAVLEQLKESGVAVIRQENAGLAAARMAGVRSTSAPYVLALDADDILEPDAAALLADALDANPEAAVAWGDMQSFGATSARVPSAPAFDPWLLTHTTGIPGAGSMLRRDVLEAVGGWTLRHGPEDWDLWLSLAETDCKGVYVPQIVFRYRRVSRSRLGAGVAGSMSIHYEELRRRHQTLFASRAELRRRSAAPRTLKAAVSIVERLPLPRLAKVQLAQLLTLVLWNRELSATARMATQAIRLRLPVPSED